MDDTLKGLHRIVYPSHGVSKKTVKANLRQFHGFSTGREEMTKQVFAAEEKLGKWMLAGLKDICDCLGLEKSGTKEAVVGRIVDFLKVPTDVGKKVPQVCDCGFDVAVT